MTLILQNVTQGKTRSSLFLEILHWDFKPYLKIWLDYYLLMLVVMVLALQRSHREPSRITTIIIYHMFSPNPQQLVALMQTQLSQSRLIPPELLFRTTTALLQHVSCIHRGLTLATINFKIRVRRYKWRMGPVCLDTASLSGPVICIPYWTVHAHGLVFRVRHTLVFQVRVHSNWRIIHQKSATQL